jgi:hypothetical protein
MMTNLAQYATGPASAAQVCQLWSDRVDALERHLSAKMWALSAASVVLIAYPMLRVACPVVLHNIVAVLQGIVPDVVRMVLASI